MEKKKGLTKPQNKDNWKQEKLMWAERKDLENLIARTDILE